MKRELGALRFSRLVVIEEAGRTAHGEVRWHCLCDCGNETFATTGNLTKGNTQSCGCYQRERVRAPRSR